jgi:hypothetical protein
MSIPSSTNPNVDPAVALKELHRTLERLNEAADAASPSIASIRSLVLLRIGELEAASTLGPSRQYN